MAQVNFDQYLNKSIDEIEAPKPLPVGHYFATIGNPGWKVKESKGEKKSPMVEVEFTLQSADADVDPAMLPEGGVANKRVQTNFVLTSEFGQFNLRRMMEEALGLPVSGLSLGDGLAQIAGQPVKLYIEQRNATDGTDNVFADVKKILSVDG